MASTAEYLVGPRIGEGSFGEVRVCKHKTTKLDVAIKVVDKNSLKRHRYGRQLGKALVQEQQILRNLKDCDSVVNLFASFHDKECVYLVLELCTGGSLQDVIDQAAASGGTTTSSNVAAAYYGLQVLSGLECLHAQHSILHLDIKPSNCLLTDKGRIKITDFGSAHVVSVVPPNNEKKKKNGHRGSSDDDEWGNMPRGTTAYSAPEIIQSKRDLTVAADLWSLGCLLYALCIATSSPFDKDGSDALTVQAIQEYCRSKNVGTVSSNVVAALGGGDWTDLILALLRPDPKERLGAEEYRTRSTSTTTDAAVDNGKKQLDDTKSAFRYSSIRSHSVWNDVDLSQDPEVLPKVPAWWKDTTSRIHAMKDGKDGWSVFLAE